MQSVMKIINKMAPSSCYCSQSGDINLNMLECAKCRRWFHEGCVKCLNLPMLFGDRFYIFVCSVCNAGSECLGRLEMDWEEVAHLLLYNLTILEKKKYFHIDNTMIPFLEDNWERFQLTGPVADGKKNIRTKVLQALQKSTSKFKCGKEVKKCKNIWALRIRIPPEAPNVLPSAARLKKDVVIWDFQVKDKTYQIFSLKRSTNKENCKNGKPKSAVSSVHQKNEEVSKCRGSVPHVENGIKAKHKNKHTKLSSFSENSARSGLLDSLIPFPPDFKNCNNPFLKSYKKSNFKRMITHNKSSTGIKRQKVENYCSDMPILNGSYQSSGDSYKESISLLKTKEDKLHRTKDVDFCIMGKRTTATGKVQFLIQQNRRNLKNMIAEKCKITVLCKCNKCKRFNELEK